MAATLVPLPPLRARITPARAYDAPNLTCQQWLEAVMHDQHLPITVRMQAATILQRCYPPEIDPAPDPVELPIRVVIQGFEVQGLITKGHDA